jgi:hypothetical protein
MCNNISTLDDSILGHFDIFLVFYIPRKIETALHLGQAAVIYQKSAD